MISLGGPWVNKNIDWGELKKSENWAHCVLCILTNSQMGKTEFPGSKECTGMPYRLL